MAIITSALAIAALKRPLEDLYNAGKAKFETELSKLLNENARKLLAQKVLVFDKVRTIWQKNKDVRISKMYYAPQIVFSDSVSRPVDSLAKLSTTQNYVIEGTVGQGKSVFLRYLCLQELKDKDSARIPIFFEFRTLEKHKTLESATKAALSNLGFKTTGGLYEFYLESGKVVLLIDGFDELPSSLTVNVMDEIDALSVTYPELQIIITSRPNRDIQKSPRFSVLSIAPLSSDDFEPFLTRIGMPTDLRMQLITALSADGSRVASLLTTPLMLTLAAFVYRSERDIPPELPQFYEVLFQTVFTAHDKSKIAFTRECKSGLDERVLQRFFECFCFMSFNDGNIRSLKTSSFEKAFTKALTYSKEKCAINDFKHDIIDVACLMQTEGFDTTFIHQSVQEYYASSFIKNCYDDAAKKFYESVRKQRDSMWSQVLQFLCTIDEYRWAKFYRLPLLNEAEKAINALGNKDHEIAKELISNVSIYCQLNDNGKAELTGWIAFHESQFISQQLDRLMLRLLSLYKQSDFELVMREGMPSAALLPHHLRDVKTLPLSRIITTDELIAFSLNLKKFVKQLRADIIRLSAIVELEEKKIDVFSVKPVRRTRRIP